MANAERLEKLKQLSRKQITEDYPQPVDTIQNMNERVVDYLLSWDDPDHRALICAKTGNTTAYYRPEGDVIEEYRGKDLEEFRDEIDERIEELEEGEEYDPFHPEDDDF